MPKIITGQNTCFLDAWNVINKGKPLVIDGNLYTQQRGNVIVSKNGSQRILTNGIPIQ